MGSCMGPLLFVVYASELFDIIESHLPEVHRSADTDTRLYLSLKPGDANAQDVAAAAMEYCPSLSSLHLPQNNFPELFQSLSIVQVGGRRKRQVFSKPLHCTQNFTGSYKYCITVPKTLIEDCKLLVSRTASVQGHVAFIVTINAVVNTGV